MLGGGADPRESPDRCEEMRRVWGAGKEGGRLDLHCPVEVEITHACKATAIPHQNRKVGKGGSSLNAEAYLAYHIRSLTISTQNLPGCMNGTFHLCLAPYLQAVVDPVATGVWPVPTLVNYASVSGGRGVSASQSMCRGFLECQRE